MLLLGICKVLTLLRSTYLYKGRPCGRPIRLRPSEGTGEVRFRYRRRTSYTLSLLYYDHKKGVMRKRPYLKKDGKQRKELVHYAPKYLIFELMVALAILSS